MVFLTMGIPFVFFALLEALIRFSGINTDVVKSKNFQVEVPVWASNDINFFAAEGIYRQILDNTLSVESADWLNYFEEASYVHYKMKPRVSAYVTNTVNRIELEKGIKVFMKSNSEGFRTEEIPIHKEKNVYRIVLLGDSSTFGWGVNQDERFSRFLEDKLNSVQNSTRYEIINLGIPGYTTDHGMAAFQHYALKYSPDMMILSFGANDGKPVPQRAKKFLKLNPWMEDLQGFLRNFSTYKLMRKILLSFYNPFDALHSQNPKGPVEPFVTFLEYQKNLEYLIDTGREKGIETVLLGLCCPKSYLDIMRKVAQSKNVPMIDGMHVLIQSIPEVQEGKHYPELARHYKDLFGEESLRNRRLWYVTSDTCHPNVIGHRILAEALYDRIFAEKIKP
ncbi:MAG TPA: GDSL-type esterase/lipase family protein [Candidatus Limnocylindrales bacterium]|nr:GDSL-type esterase/lipase family protein [Candidatus Limnocylindrales bacterium]